MINSAKQSVAGLFFDAGAPLSFAGSLLRVKNIYTSHTLLAAESGNIITTHGSTGAVTFTLPTAVKGYWWLIYNDSDQNVAVTTMGATGVAYNSQTATTITYQTNPKGAFFLVFHDGFHWCTATLSEHAVTIT